MTSRESAVSVVVPVFNGAGYIEACIRTLMGQMDVLREVIVVDDGSVDETLQVLRRLQLDFDGLRLVAIHHQGVSAARNAGMAAAQGDYIWFVDADDSILPGAATGVRKVLNGVSADMVLFGYKKTFLDGREWVVVPRERREEVFRPELFFEEEVSRPYVWNCLYRRAFLEREGVCFKHGLAVGEDQLFQFQAFLKARSWYFSAAVIYEHKIHLPGSVMDGLGRVGLKRCMAHLLLAEPFLELGMNREGSASLKPFLERWIEDLFVEDSSRLNVREHKAFKRAYLLMMSRVGHDLFSPNRGLVQRLRQLSIRSYPVKILYRTLRRMCGRTATV